MTREPDIRPYRGKRPQIAASAYIDPAAVIIGDVVIGEDSSVWPCSVVRGDVHYIRIGARTNIQDGSVLHVMRDEYPLILGDDVTIGHSVTLHGCVIQDRCLIGMGSVILNGARIGSGSVIAAGCVITEKTMVEPGSLWAGVPVLTCAGAAFASRVAGSLLHAIGLPELITGSLADYEALALRLARAPERLTALRQKLARNRAIFPLFDTARFARHVEAAYVTMWERSRRGELPRSFAVAPIV